MKQVSNSPTITTIQPQHNNNNNQIQATRINSLMRSLLTNKHNRTNCWTILNSRNSLILLKSNPNQTKSITILATLKLIAWHKEQLNSTRLSYSTLHPSVLMLIPRGHRGSQITACMLLLVRLTHRNKTINLSDTSKSTKNMAHAETISQKNKYMIQSTINQSQPPLDMQSAFSELIKKLSVSKSLKRKAIKKL